MPRISLSVTSAVVRAVSSQGEFQKQISVSAWSPDLERTAMTASRGNTIAIDLGGIFGLVLGDTNAFWRVHQSDDYVEFDHLYDLLARHPDRCLTLTW